MIYRFVNGKNTIKYKYIKLDKSIILWYLSF